MKKQLKGIFTSIWKKHAHCAKERFVQKFAKVAAKEAFTLNVTKTSLVKLKFYLSAQLKLNRNSTKRN